MNTNKRKIVNTRSADLIDRLIYEHHVFIKHVEVIKKYDKLIIFLNTNNVLPVNLSDFPGLRDANEKQLKNLSIIHGGIGIHWKSLDEDLSLKGFIQSIKPNERKTVIRKLQRNESIAFA